MKETHSTNSVIHPYLSRGPFSRRQPPAPVGARWPAARRSARLPLLPSVGAPCFHALTNDEAVTVFVQEGALTNDAARGFDVLELAVQALPSGDHAASWVELDGGLDGRVLFLARCSSRAFEASQFAGFQKGVYFLDDTGFVEARQSAAQAPRRGAAAGSIRLPGGGRRRGSTRGQRPTRARWSAREAAGEAVHGTGGQRHARWQIFLFYFLINFQGRATPCLLRKWKWFAGTNTRLFFLNRPWKWFAGWQGRVRKSLQRWTPYPAITANSY
ncbi:hypothetical protein SEVIR_9G173501v4 [Setaria viridis]